MPCKEWFGIEKQYRIAVHAYCDAVDRLDSTKDFEVAWEQIELARMRSDHDRAALLRHQMAHSCVPVRGSLEDLILGDQGQPGG